MIESTQRTNNIEENGHLVKLKAENNVFFSLTTLKNDLFYSKDPKKLLQFYSTFSNAESIIDWLENRPKGRTKIIEVEGDKDCIVVIPTANHNNEYSQKCRDEIFKGMHIIFVESGNYSDPFFSFSHSCNVGLKKALEYSPTFIVWSNDDMLEHDDSERLKSELKKILNNKVKAVFAKHQHQVSTPVKVIEFNLIGKLILGCIKKTKLYKNIIENTNQKIKFNHNSRFLNSFHEKILKLSLYCKFQVRFLLANKRWAFSSILFKTITEYTNFDAFGILKVNHMNCEGLFDENLMVQHADQDLSLRFGLDEDSISWIDYSIEGVGRATIKDTVDERLRNILADIYIDYKIRNNKYPIILKN